MTRSILATLLMCLAMSLSGCGGASHPAASANGSTPGISVTISPFAASVLPGNSVQFTATVLHDPVNQGVTWSFADHTCTAANCGTIDAAGKYTAPPALPSPPTFTLIATAISDPSASAGVRVTIDPPQGAAPALLLIGNTPAQGISVLSFSATVSEVTLQPGDVSLVKNPVSVELSRLQVEKSLLASIPVPPGTYTSLTIKFANPKLTILNSSGSGIGSCGSGAICKLTPPLANSSLSLTGPPFPITGDGSTPVVLILDFDLSKSLSADGSLEPVITVQGAPFMDGKRVTVKQADGAILYTGGDDIVDGAFFDLATDLGILKNIADGFYVDVDPRNLCGDFYCVQGKIAEVDVLLDGGAYSVARRVVLKPPDQPEVEGVIVGINSDSQFDIVVLHQMPAVAGLELGDLIRVNVQPSSTFQLADLPVSGSRLHFVAPVDLMTGQVVSVRVGASAFGDQTSISTDRVRLKSGAISGRVSSIIDGNNLILDAVPGNFPAGAIQVQVSTGNLNQGDAVSLSGFLLKGAGNPLLVAEDLRKR